MENYARTIWTYYYSSNCNTYFGGKRLKNLGSDLGGAIKGFKSSVKDAETEKEEIIEVELEETDDHEEVEIEISDDTSEKNSEK